MVARYSAEIAEPYLTDLKRLADQWMEADDRVGVLECRHFFSGAAVYRDDKIVSTLTPVGLAFKVPAEVHDELLDSGLATPLRYFPNAPVKKNYVLFPSETAVAATNAVRLLLGDHLHRG
ncbi:MAG: hypothetical protein ACC658_14885 [Acidimicrobiia bacterium]